ncbi:MAG: UbiA prenyltransferase family protein [Calditrichota bacterium]
MTNDSGFHRRSLLRLLWGTLRPRQWIKNTFVLAPAIFTLQILNPEIWLRLFTGAAGFCLAASAVYTINDIINCEEDRRHPLKKRRPIASGEVAKTTGWILAIVVLFGSSLFLFFSGESVLLTVWVYVGLMILYSLFLRRLFILDVIIIAVGFVLRVIAGAELIQEPISHWLLLCTFTIALFLGMIKRRQEIVVMNANSDQLGRSALTSYQDTALVDGWINIFAGMTILCYALYTVDPATRANHQTTTLMYTIPCVIYGISRYQKLALIGHAGEDPASLIIRDPGIKIVIGLWVLTVGGLLIMAN